MPDQFAVLAPRVQQPVVSEIPQERDHVLNRHMLPDAGVGVLPKHVEIGHLEVAPGIRQPIQPRILGNRFLLAPRQPVTGPHGVGIEEAFRHEFLPDFLSCLPSPWGMRNLGDDSATERPDQVATVLAPDEVDFHPSGRPSRQNRRGKDRIPPDSGLSTPIYRASSTT